MDEDEEHEGWRASLAILTDAWSSARLARAVGLTPSRSWDCGEVRSSRDRRVTQRYSGIAYHSALAGPADIHDHLGDLLARLAPYRERIASLSKALAAEPGAMCSIRLRLVVAAHDDAQGLHFPLEQLRCLVECGADLDITVEFWGDDLEQRPD